MARRNFDLRAADRPRETPPIAVRSPAPPSTAPSPVAGVAAPKEVQKYRHGKRGVQFFLAEEAFNQMHVLLARQGRRKVQDLMEELVDDWFRRENAPRLTR